MTEKYVKSPLNYVGGKHKLLPQILPHFPKDIDTFIDVFAGGGNVSANIDADLIIVNDKQKEVIDLIFYFYDNEYEQIEKDLIRIIKKYGLIKNGKEGYLKLRKDYNDGERSPEMFYALICHSFNHQIRFNKKHNFNMPVGLGTFNAKLRERLKEFVDCIKEKNLVFTSLDFRNVIDHVDTDKSFVYCDPPYLIATAAYNEQGGWSEQDEKDLLTSLDDINDKGGKFALSNVLEHKERHNEILGEWSQKYNVIDLNYSYANANYQSTKRDSVTREVLITNYETEAE